MTTPPAMTALTEAQAQLELTAEHVAKRMVSSGIGHDLAMVLIEAVAACRAARRVGDLPPAATQAAPLRIGAAPILSAAVPRTANVVALGGNTRRRAIDDAVRTVLCRFGDQKLTLEDIAAACAGTAVDRAFYRSDETQREAVRDSVQVLIASGEVVRVREGRFLAVIPTRKLLDAAAAAQRAHRGAA